MRFELLDHVKSTGLGLSSGQSVGERGLAFKLAGLEFGKSSNLHFPVLH